MDNLLLYFIIPGTIAILLLSLFIKLSTKRLRDREYYLELINDSLAYLTGRELDLEEYDILHLYLDEDEVKFLRQILCESLNIEIPHTRIKSWEKVENVINDLIYYTHFVKDNY